MNKGTHFFGQRIKSLLFFGYEVNEPLHVSDSKRQTIESLMENLEHEYQHEKMRPHAVDTCLDLSIALAEQRGKEIMICHRHCLLLTNLAP